MFGKKRNETKDPVFEFETVSAPIKASDTIRNAEISWWEKNVVLIVVALAMACMDGFFLFDMMDLAMTQNAVLGFIGAAGIALILNLIPLAIAKQVNNARYGLDKNARTFALVGFGLFTLLYAAVVILRFNCLELYTSSNSGDLVNTISAGEAESGISSEARSRAVTTALLLSIEPLATSGFSFVLAVLTDNPIRNKIRAVERRLDEIKTAKNRVSTALAAMWEDKEFLLSNDMEQLVAAKEQVEDDANRLMSEGRMMLAEKLGDASAISYLAAGNVEEKTSSIAPMKEKLSHETEERQIA